MSEPLNTSTLSVQTTVDASDDAAIGVLHLVRPTSLKGFASPLSVLRQPVGLGRLPPVDGATIAHRTVSRHHADIAWNEKLRTHQLRDAGSHNGTRCQARDVGRHWRALRDGDVIRLGDVVFVYERIRELLRSAAADRGPDIIGVSVASQQLRQTIAKAAPDRAPALVVGETGTGKEWVARALHRLSGRRGDLVAVNCATISGNLVESELFGHVRGAFTGADRRKDGVFVAAHGGTLLLDEIGDLPLAMQPKLLRVLQEGVVRPVGGTRPHEVNVRVVAATNRDLTQAVAAGSFRRDLFARLALWEIGVPSLAERRADILPWLHWLTARWFTDRDRQPMTFDFDAAAVESLLVHSWPDNLRGLQRLAHRLATNCEAGCLVDAPTLQRFLPKPALRTPSEHGDNEADEQITAAISLPTTRSSRRPAPPREQLVEILRDTGSVRAAAARMQRARRQIYRWISTYAIEKDEWTDG